MACRPQLPRTPNSRAKILPWNSRAKEGRVLLPTAAEEDGLNSRFGSLPMNRSRASVPFLALLVISLCSSCGVLKESVTHGLVDGYYRTRPAVGPSQRVYLDVEADSITAYAVAGTDAGRVIDTTAFSVYPQVPVEVAGPCGAHTFVKHALDLDLVYALLKYRPATAGVPPQLNTDLNGSLYVGYKTDRYTLACVRDPLGRQHRLVRNAGFDMGGFVGLGATTMNASVTQDPIAIEYTGMVLTSGVGVFTSVGGLGFGLSCGWDHLLDEYGARWIYQDQPWLGLSIGVNLN